MRMGPQLLISSDGLEKLESEPAIPVLLGEWFINSTIMVLFFNLQYSNYRSY